MTFNISLPVERGRQLQMIAEREGKTVVDVITDHIRAKIEAGVIPSELPGISIETTDDAVKISGPGFGGAVRRNDVRSFLDALRSGGMATRSRRSANTDKLIEAVAGLSGIKVQGMAKGVRLVSLDTGNEYAMSFSVASDLAKQIDRELLQKLKNLEKAR